MTQVQSVATLVAGLRLRGVELWAENDQLRYRATRGQLPANALDQLKAKKTEVLNWLRERESQTDIPLSAGQQALWFIYELAPDNPAYNLNFLAETAASDATVASALEILTDRHVAFRTVYESDGPHPVQRVKPNSQFTLEIIAQQQRSDEDVRRMLNEIADKPFDLRNGPVIRATLVTRADRDALLSVTIHHIALDLVSLDIIVTELNQLLAGGEPDEIGASVDSRDYVRWENDMLASPVGDAHWAFWHERLSGQPDPLDLPTDRPRPPIQTFAGQAVGFELADRTAAQVRKVAAENSVTPYMLLLSIWQVLLARYSGQRRFLVGTPTWGRSNAAFEKTVGFFVNPVPLRVMLDDDPDMATLLTRTRDEVASAIEHQDFPFPILVERLKPRRDPGRAPLFSVEFAWERMHHADEDSALQLVAAEQRGANLDMSLMMFDDGDALSGSWRYNTALFDRATIERMVANFSTLLDSALADTTRPVFMLETLTKAEKNAVIHDWNDTAALYPQDLLLQHLFEQRAAKDPDAVALVGDQGELTYAELNSRANRLAHFLTGQGIGPEQPVAIHMARSFDMVVALYATLKAGGAWLPLDPDYPLKRKAFVLEETAANVVLTQRDLVKALPDTKASVFAVEDIADQLASFPDTLPAVSTEPDNLAYIIYTSGSTGTPKGVMNTHRGICNRLLWMQSEFDIGPADCVIQKTPYTFDVSVWEFFWPLQTGARLAVLPPDAHKDPHELARFINDHKVTVMHFVPPMLEVFLQGKPDCPTLRNVILSGEALPAELVRRFNDQMKAGLSNLYGPTEAAVDVTFWHCLPGDERQSIPIGRPVANTRIYILDALLQPVPIGAAGEIYIGGVQVARGYMNRDDLTGQRFVPDPFGGDGARLYRTGDIGRFGADGQIEYMGRNDHQVKLRGLRIELGEIENAIRRHQSVTEAVVIAREDQPGNKRLAAYVVAGEGFDPTALLDEVSNELPDYMVPPDLVELDAMPLSANGKIDRRRLPAPKAAARADFVAAGSEVESTIAEIWAEALGVDRVGINDNFFDLGGHSLLLAQIQNRVQSRLDKRLSYVDLFRHPTVAALARLFGDSAPGNGAADNARARAQRQREQLSRQKELAARRRQPRGR